MPDAAGANSLGTALLGIAVLLVTGPFDALLGKFLLEQAPRMIRHAACTNKRVLTATHYRNGRQVARKTAWSPEKPC